MIDLSQHRVVHVGSTEPFFVRPAEPFDNVALTYPEVEFTTYGGASNATSMARLFEPLSVIGASGSTLTLAAPFSSAAGLQFDLGDAWLRTTRDGARLVRIVRIAGATIELADYLTGSVDVTSATIESALWYANLTSSETGTPTQTTAGNRPLAWRVTWSSQPGSAAPRTPRQMAGTLSVVRRVFDTGLDTFGLISKAPELARAIPDGQVDLAPQIRQALAEIGLAVRQHVLGLPGLEGFGTEHDTDGSMLVEAHAALAAARVLGMTNPARAALLAEDGRRMLKAGLACLWVDINRDGAINGDEAQTAVSTTQATQAARQITSVATCRQFPIGGRR